MKRVVCLGARLFSFGFITRHSSEGVLFMRTGVSCFSDVVLSGMVLTDASDHHARTQVQQLASFTVHTGLAEQLFTCLRGFSAFPTCYFPLCVSAPGWLDVLEVLTPFLSRVTRVFHMHRHGAPNPLVHPGRGQTPAAETALGRGEPCSIGSYADGLAPRCPDSPRPGAAHRACARYTAAWAADAHFRPAVRRRVPQRPRTPGTAWRGFAGRAAVADCRPLYPRFCENGCVRGRSASYSCLR